MTNLKALNLFLSLVGIVAVLGITNYPLNTFLIFDGETQLIPAAIAFINYLFTNLPEILSGTILWIIAPYLLQLIICLRHTEDLTQKISLGINVILLFSLYYYLEPTTSGKVSVGWEYLFLPIFQLALVFAGSILTLIINLALNKKKNQII